MRDNFIKFCENFDKTSLKDNRDFLNKNRDYIIEIFQKNGFRVKAIYFQNHLMSLQGQIETTEKIGLYEFDKNEFLELLDDFIKVL